MSYKKPFGSTCLFLSQAIQSIFHYLDCVEFKRGLLFSIQIFTTLFAYNTTAAENFASDSDYFVSIKASLGEVTIDDISHRGSIGGGQVTNGIIDGALRDTSVQDYTAGISLSIARQVGSWDVEAEYTYRYRTDWDVAAITNSIQAITNISSNIETHGVMLNASHQLIERARWNWYAGVGVGVVVNLTKGYYIERALPGIRQEVEFSDTNSSTDFSYAIFSGFDWQLSQRWKFGAAIRYIHLGDLDIGPFPQRSAVLEGDHNSIEVQFSVTRSL